MSQYYSGFPFGAPLADTDRFLIGRVDGASPTGFSNYLMTWAEIKAAIGAVSGGSSGMILPESPDEPDEPILIPGPRGLTGATGGVGPGTFNNIIVMSVLDGSDGEDAEPIPGQRGLNGNNGNIGIDGKTIFMLPDSPEDPDEPILIKGDRGLQGPQGNPGVGGGGGTIVQLFEEAQETEEFMNTPYILPRVFVGKQNPGSFTIPDRGYAVLAREHRMELGDVLIIEGNGALVVI